MAWRVARSLNVLLDQLNALAPNRDKRSDGSIGDVNHQNRTSDHNPWYGPGIVTARDFTHDPDDMDCQSVANRLVRWRDPRIKYIIWNRRIWTPTNGWINYTGSNPHTSHLHLSVVASPLCDDPTRWKGFEKAVERPPVQEDEMAGFADSVEFQSLNWLLEALATGKEVVADGPTEGSPVQHNVTLNALAWRMHALTYGLDKVPEGPKAGEEMWAVQQLRQQAEEIAALQAKVDELVAQHTIPGETQG